MFLNFNIGVFLLQGVECALKPSHCWSGIVIKYSTSMVIHPLWYILKLALKNSLLPTICKKVDPTLIANYRLIETCLIFSRSASPFITPAPLQYGLMKNSTTISNLATFVQFVLHELLDAADKVVLIYKKHLITLITFLYRVSNENP